MIEGFARDGDAERGRGRGAFDYVDAEIGGEDGGGVEEGVEGGGGGGGEVWGFVMLV